MPTAVLMTPPYLQFFDVNGVPLAGGSVTTYAAGTNTLKATYTTAVGDIPATNPIVLDSSGRATIWGNGAYKLVVKDSTGAIVPFGTTDGIITFNTSSSSIDAILPDQTGQAGKFLGTNGANASWQSPLSASIFANKVTSGLTLTNDTTDSVNDIAISAGSCVSDDGTTVMTLSTAYVKQLDNLWTVGTPQGGRDTGAISDATWFVYAINRPDTGVTDILFSLSKTAPTLPTNYTKKKLLGAFIRASGAILQGVTNYGDNIAVGTTRTAAGTFMDFLDIPATAKRVIINYMGVSTSGTSNWIVQLGASGGNETTGYLSNGSRPNTLSSTATTGILVLVSPVAAENATGRMVIELNNAVTNQWIGNGIINASGANGFASGGGYKSLSGVLDRVRVTMLNGTDTFDAGTINVLFE